MKTFTLRDSKHFVIAAVAAVSFAAVAQLAQAADMVDERPAMTVRYSDLNLDTQAGAAALYQRIRHAAERVCGNADSRQLTEVVVVQNCVDKAIACSVSAVGNAQLTNQYLAQSGQPPQQVVVASAVLALF